MLWSKIKTNKKRLKRTLMLIRQCKTCANVEGKPLFQTTNGQLNQLTMGGNLLTTGGTKLDLGSAYSSTGEDVFGLPKRDDLPSIIFISSKHKKVQTNAY